MTTNRHGVASFYFAKVTGCDQLVVVPTYAYGRILDLLMTDVHDIVLTQVMVANHSGVTEGVMEIGFHNCGGR